MSRSNDITITVHCDPQTNGRADQVRNGHRWRVVALDPDTNRIAAERLSDCARVVFDDDYLKSHVTLGYAATIHSAQGVTADSCSVEPLVRTASRPEHESIPEPASHSFSE